MDGYTVIHDPVLVTHIIRQASNAGAVDMDSSSTIDIMWLKKNVHNGKTQPHQEVEDGYIYIYIF